MMGQATALEGGFADPVLDAQSVFRSVMDAMARPATVVGIVPGVMPPAPLPPSVGAIAATLLDADTPVWLDPVLAGSAKVREWLVFHSAAPLADAPGEAAFALIANAGIGGSTFPDLGSFAQGTQEYPDRSATLVVTVESFEGGAPLAFRGPGIATTATISPRGLPCDFTAQWQENSRRFPRGVDLVLVAGNAIACLPRSARLIIGEA